MKLSCSEPGVEVVVSEWIGTDLESIQSMVDNADKYGLAQTLVSIDRQVGQMLAILSDHVQNTGTCNWEGEDEDVTVEVRGYGRNTEIGWRCPLCNTMHRENPYEDD